jgi:hypothetical protein
MWVLSPDTQTTEGILGILKTAKKGLHVNSFERYYILVHNSSSGKTNHLLSFDMTPTLQKTMPPTIIHCCRNIITELLPSNDRGINFNKAFAK